MAKIFLDVGAHYGESVHSALDPVWQFDQVHCFEPAAISLDTLRRFKDRRIAVHPFALGARNRRTMLYNAGTLGASIYPDKITGTRRNAEEVEIRDVSAWLEENLSRNDLIFMKLNCEGSEADIIERLDETGHLGWVDSILISLDIRKIPSQQHRVTPLIQLLESRDVDYSVREELKARDPIRQWLEQRLPKSRSTTVSARLRHFLRLHMPLEQRVVGMAQRVMPRGIFFLLAGRFGRTSRATRSARSGRRGSVVPQTAARGKREHSG